MITQATTATTFGALPSSSRRRVLTLARGARVLTLAVAVLTGIATIAAAAAPFVPAQGSTSPANGDLNPYGLAVVPAGFPGTTLQAGQLLVSNFNNSAANGNIQGQGSTIVIINPATGQQTGVFFQANRPIGFTNALQIARAGFVFAGSVFTTGAGNNPQNGGLLVLNSSGAVVTVINSGVNGAWGLALNDKGDTAQLFVSNVLDGTVTRLDLRFANGAGMVAKVTTIGSGYSFGPDSAGVVVGPAGLAYNAAKDTLFVASEDDNEIFAIPNAGAATSSAGQGKLIYSDSTHLHGPLGLMIAPDGNLVTANADPAAHVDPTQPSELVEFTLGGTFVRQFSIDPNTGSAFAILNVPTSRSNEFAYVDDFSSILNILQLAK